MNFYLRCECDYRLTVNEGAAGATLTCPECQKPVSVPSLAELRSKAGFSPHDLMPEVILAQKLQSAELKAEPFCSGCSAPSDRVAQVAVDCERAHVEPTSGGVASGLSLMFIVVCVCLVGLPLLLLPFMGRLRESEETTEWGEDKIYWLPLTLCERCDQNLQGEQDLKGCLATIPLYAEILEIYPESGVAITRRD